MLLACTVVQRFITLARLPAEFGASWEYFPLAEEGGVGKSMQVTVLITRRFKVN